MQIFPRKLNLLPLVLGAAVFIAGGAVTFVVWYYFSPKNLQVGYAPDQPVPYSHRLHAGELGLDCRYCHANVERSYEAMVPPTQTCMGCHNIVRTDSARLEPVRQSWQTNQPVAWVRVHKLPDHVFFDHSVHLAASVGCVTCHGRIDQMDVVRQEQPLSMAWCLDCHRDPGPNLRPPAEITSMQWEPDEAWTAQVDARVAALNPPIHCSGCHR
ncbi:MAG: cytochrome c3 family protein [Deltaproteobacteria bacterium]|nr:cytochrome c3 family protein [Deltaproteobacteria bacterium]